MTAIIFRDMVGYNISLHFFNIQTVFATKNVK